MGYTYGWSASSFTDDFATTHFLEEPNQIEVRENEVAVLSHDKRTIGLFDLNGNARGLFATRHLDKAADLKWTPDGRLVIAQGYSPWLSELGLLHLRDPKTWRTDAIQPRLLVSSEAPQYFGRFPDEVYNPTGVAIEPETGHFWVTDDDYWNDRYRIAIFSPSGELLLRTDCPSYEPLLVRPESAFYL